MSIKTCGSSNHFTVYSYFVSSHESNRNFQKHHYFPYWPFQQNPILKSCRYIRHLKQSFAFKNDRPIIYFQRLGPIRHCLYYKILLYRLHGLVYMVSDFPPLDNFLFNFRSYHIINQYRVVPKTSTWQDQI